MVTVASGRELSASLPNGQQPDYTKKTHAMLRKEGQYSGATNGNAGIVALALQFGEDSYKQAS